jgi:hypothetical protein
MHYGIAEEMKVDGRLNQNTVTRICKRLNRNVDPRYNPGKKQHLLLGHFPAVKLPHPDLNRVDQFLWQMSVSKYAVIDTAAQSQNNRISGSEVHVRHPQGDDFTGIGRPFDAVCVSPLDDLIKVIYHG